MNIGGKDGLENMYRSACALLRPGNLDGAWGRFTEICDEYSWSYKGYYGLPQVEMATEEYTYRGQPATEYIRKMEVCEKSEEFRENGYQIPGNSEREEETENSDNAEVELHITSAGPNILNVIKIEVFYNWKVLPSSHRHENCRWLFSTYQ